MIIRKYLKVFLLSLFSGASLYAGGFQVNFLGIKQTGMGHAGAGLYLDAAAMGINPGATVFGKVSSFTAGGNFIMARVNYLEKAPGTYSTWNEKTLSTPFAAYANFKVSDKMSLGAAIYTPFGSRVLYADDWKGQFLLREINLKAIFIQPTLSYKITPKMGLGIAPILSTGSVLLRRAVPAQFQDGSYGEANLEGSAIGYGFNAGIFYKLNQKWSFGAAYRSAVKFKADEGKATFNVPSSLSEYFPNTNFTTQITLPSMATIGVGFQPTQLLAFALDVNYIGWSVYDTLGFDFEQNTDNLADLASPRQYKNSFYIRMGMQYSLAKIVARAGFYYDKSPVQAGYLTPETPDADKIGISLGTTYRIGRHIDLDASFLWVEGKKRADTNLESNFGGTYKARAFIPSIGINWRFDLKKNIEPEIN